MKLFSFIKETIADAFRIVRSPKEGIKSLYGVSLKTVDSQNHELKTPDSGLMTINYDLGFVFWILVAVLYQSLSMCQNLD